MAAWFSRHSTSQPASGRSRPWRRFLGEVAFPSVVIGVAVIVVRQLGGLEAVEIGMYDRFIRWRPDEGLDNRLLVVGVSETDLQTLNEYPLTDGTVADLLTELETYEPRAIALDIGRDIPQGDEAGREQLRQVMEESDRIISACLLSSALQPGAAPAPGADPEDQVGFADFPQDEGGVVRRSTLVSVPVPPPENWPNRHVCNNPERQPVSLSFASAMKYLEAEGIEPQPTPYDEIQLGDTILFPVFDGQYGGYQNTEAVDYQLMLNYRSATDAVRQVTLTEVMNGEVNPDWIRDRIVMIGYTSIVAGDFLSTPYLSGQEGVRGMPGVVVHAQSTSQILSAVLNQRPLIWALPPLLEWIWIVLWAGIGSVLVTYIRRTWLFLLLGAVALGFCWGLPYLLFLQGGWIPIVPPTVALGLAMAGVSILQRAKQGGYTQAIFDQLKDQLKVRMEKDAEQERQSHHVDYLEDLVQRARSIRQQRSGEVPDDSPATTATVASSDSFASPPATAPLDSETQTQDLYEQIKAQVEKDMEQDKKTATASKTAARQQQIQELLEKARNARRGTP